MIKVASCDPSCFHCGNLFEDSSKFGNLLGLLQNI